MQGIVKWPQVRINLTLQITGKKAQLLSRFDRRTGQNNPAYFVIPERRDRHSHGQIGFACSGRSDAEGNHVLPDRVHIPLLSKCLGLHRTSADGMADIIPVKLYNRLRIVLHRERQDIVNVLLCNLVPPA